MGEGVFVILLGSKKSLGGRSKHLGDSAVGAVGRVMRAVQGLGLPGSSSHLNGTEAEAYKGGVSVPECSGDCTVAIENRGSFGVEVVSSSMATCLLGFPGLRGVGRDVST